MKGCLIISTPRSGSTNLMKSIASAYSIPEQFEPFAIGGSKKASSNKITKVIVERLTVKRLIALSREYDKTVLLTRKDATAASESWCFMKENLDISFVNVKWTSASNTFNPKKLDEYKLRFNSQVGKIEKLSKALNTPIDYYEDLYHTKTLLDTSIKLDLTFLDSSKKLRAVRNETYI
jgi:hypothetical protein